MQLIKASELSYDQIQTHYYFNNAKQTMATLQNQQSLLNLFPAQMNNHTIQQSPLTAKITPSTSTTPSPNKQPTSPLQINASSESYQSKFQLHFQDITYHNKTVEEIEKSTQEILQQIKLYEQIIDKKISKYYTQLREPTLQKDFSLDVMLETLKNQKRLREQLILFQQLEIKDIQEIAKTYDSKANIEFAIPLQINDTKKTILQLEKFCHIAKIRQKKKSQDLVKVEKNNIQQFEKTAMLRTQLQVQMIYQLNLNDREMKLDQSLYDFQCKTDAINDKLIDLNRIVEQKHILVSSNKGLIILKEKKIHLTKKRDQQNKKIALIRNNLGKNETTIRKDIENMKKQILEKEARYTTIDKQLEDIIRKNNSYIINDTITKNLKKSISYNYAQTLLKIKTKAKLQNPNALTMSMNASLLSQSLTLKPNFKVKKVRNQLHSSLVKNSSTKKSSSLVDQMSPITDNKQTNPEIIKARISIQLPPAKTERSHLQMRQKLNKQQQLDEQIIIQE